MNTELLERRPRSTMLCQAIVEEWKNISVARLRLAMSAYVTDLETSVRVWPGAV